MKRFLCLAAVAALAIGLGGCPSADQLQQDIQIGVGFARGVACGAAGQGGQLANSVEAAVQAKQAWVDATGRVVAASAKLCLDLGGVPGPLVN